MNEAPRIALLCATKRGHIFLQTLIKLLPGCSLTVFSFRESLGEPPFFDDIRATTVAAGHKFIEARKVDAPKNGEVWDSTVFDILFAVSWRYLVPPAIFKRIKLGAYVFHDSLLPERRGFSPTVWAIAQGDDHTGATLFEMDDGVDSGRVVAQARIPIGPDDTIADVMPRVTQSYVAILQENLPLLLARNAPGTTQDESHATYCRRRTIDDNRIDWLRSAKEINDLIRAVTTPYSGAFTLVGGRRLRIWSSAILPRIQKQSSALPGETVEVLPNIGTLVHSVSDLLLLKQVQLDHGDVMCAAHVLDRRGIKLG